MNKYQKMLMDISDKGYATFQAGLTPTISPDLFIGCRVPEVRKLAKKLYKENDYQDFINELPHKYYDENMLHGLIVSEMKDYEKCMFETEKFLPFVDNWAVCDIMSPKIFKKNKEKLLIKIKEWAASDKTYTIRFGVEMLMSHYLDDEFIPEYLEIPAKIKSDEYYVNMMLAWFYATALAKQWESTVTYIEKRVFDKWVHNKTIQKAIESYRITQDKKDYLRTLKIK